ncbi:unnamed protein product [Toxocara canis]|uniref:Transmembrane protein n=1 Tax=Toxocara canis TaxID=6265 RepID=A0A183TZH2_TOXCA|nr:unnamed protein product [Toxocara canis]
MARIQTSTSCLLDRTTAQLYLLEVDDDVTEFNKHQKVSESSGTTDECVPTHDAVCKTSPAVLVAQAVDVTSNRRVGKHAIPFFLPLMVMVLMKPDIINVITAQICSYRRIAHLRSPEEKAT